MKAFKINLNCPLNCWVQRQSFINISWLKQTGLIWLLIAIFIFYYSTSYGQARGYGNGSDGAITISSTIYTDDLNSSSYSGARTQVLSSSSSTSFVVLSTAGFNVGDLIIMAQMVGANIGHYYVEYISGINSGTSTITLSSSATGFRFGHPDDRIQMIRVPEWTNVTITDGGLLTCHDFDGYTGGILFFVANGSLTFSSASGSFTGHIVAGYDPYLSITSGHGYWNAGAGGEGGQGGTGGTGGTAGSATNPNGGAGGAADLASGTGGSGRDGWKICGDGHTAVNGGDGGNSGASNWYGPSGNQGYSSSFRYNVISSYKSIMGFGDAGDGGDGGAGGGGGSGGGGGGYGGDNSLGNAPTAGENGHPGCRGGDGGEGGAGGGVIYIRAKNIYNNGATNALIIADGCPGNPGQTAGDCTGYDGKGGNGGNGGNGTSTHGPGGGGARGYTGNGASGGNGGNGGDPGTIWVTYATTNQLVSTNVEYVSGPGGIPGMGGNPNTGVSDGTDGTAQCLSGFPTNRFCPQQSVTPHPCSYRDAFCELSTMTSASDNGSNMVTFTAPSGSYANYYYTLNPRELEVYKYSVTVQPTCSTAMVITYDNYWGHLVPNSDCDNLIKTRMKNNPGGVCSSTGDIPFNSNTTFTEITSPSILWYPTSNGSYTNATLICQTDCDISTDCTGDCPQKGHDGTTGSDGGSGSGTRYDAVQENDMDIMQPISFTDVWADSMALSNFKLLPNPAHNNITLYFTSSAASAFTFGIYDMAGRKIQEEKYEAALGENTCTIRLKSLKPGSYICKMSSGVATAAKPFIVQ